MTGRGGAPRCCGGERRVQSHHQGKGGCRDKSRWAPPVAWRGGVLMPWRGEEVSTLR